MARKDRSKSSEDDTKLSEIKTTLVGLGFSFDKKEDEVLHFSLGDLVLMVNKFGMEMNKSNWRAVGHDVSMAIIIGAVSMGKSPDEIVEIWEDAIGDW